MEIRFSAFMLILMVLFSGNGCGADIKETETASSDRILFGIYQGLQPITQSFGMNDQKSTGFDIACSETSTSATAKTQTLGEKMVKLIESIKGAKYSYKKGEYYNYKLMDAEAVKKEGIDCSGLVFWGYNKAADVSTWRPSLDTSNDVCPECIVDRYGAHYQWNDKKMWEFKKEFKEPPTESELIPGDLLYVNTIADKELIDHVGIYAGPNRVIHSTCRKMIEGECVDGGVEEISYDDWKQKYRSSFFGYGRVNGAEKPVSTSDLGGINFTSIRLNSIAVSEDGSGGVNFDLILKALKAESSDPGIDLMNSTRIGTTAFMTGLAVPDDIFWVNLNPNEVDRIIDERLEQSDVGRIMLEADLQMKKDFSNYGNPCANETGKAMWDLLDKKSYSLVQRCMNMFPGEIEGIENVRFRSATRFWIVPENVYAYSNETQIYIINATLTIYSEPVSEDSSFHVSNQEIRNLSKDCLEALNKSTKEYGEYAKELQERMIQPYVVADLNHGEKYEDLRDVYVALALAQWYKSKIPPRMDIFHDNDLSDTNLLKALKPWDSKGIWDKYVHSYKSGEYQCWENTTAKTDKRIRTKSNLYYAGGVKFADINDHLIKIDEGMPPKVQNQVNKAISNGYINEGTDVLFGHRIHLDQKKEKLFSVSSSESLNLKQDAICPSKESGVDNAANLTSEMAPGHSKKISPVGKVVGNTSRITCPDGWMGPDEYGECWQMQISG